MMSRKVWIGNGHVVLPESILENSSVLAADGKILAIGQPGPDDAEVYDTHGGYILPGFIDIHVHGGGADFMDGTVEAFKTAARAHALHGTTALVPTSMTCPDVLLERMFRSFHEAAGEADGCGAELLGLHLEGPYFSPAAKGAQPVGETRIPTREELAYFIDLAKGKLLRWDAAPELPNMELFAHVMQQYGILPAVAHTHADADETEAAFRWGFSHVTHFYNAVTTFHKKDGFVHSGVVEAAYLHDDVTVELIGDGRHIPKQSMLLAYRIKGPDRICLITDAMRAAGTEDSQSVLGPMESGVPVVIKDGVAQLTDLSSYAGSICTMDRALHTAHLDYGLPLCDVSKMLSLTPAKVSGCADRKGSLETGKDADIVVMDASFRVQNVFVRGRCITK